MHTRRVLEAILTINPKDLFVFQDGPRESIEMDLLKCQEVRRIVNEMTNDKNVNVHSFFSNHNMGCGPGPAAGISWFFDNVEQGIIIEDDAIPHPDFFQYASELLVRYKNDTSVQAIGSMNVDTCRWGDGSFYFSMMNRNLCAWATWKRAWQQFNIHMDGVSRRQLSHALKSYHCGLLEREYWCDRLDEVHKDGCGGKSWDMQFFMSIWLNHGKGIIPNVNLSSNIGTVGEATHAMASGNIIDNVPTHPILPLVYPNSENVEYEADRQFHYLYFEPNKKNWRWYNVLYYLVNKRIKKLLGHNGPWIGIKP
jgi:hypothetical protein